MKNYSNEGEIFNLVAQLRSDLEQIETELDLEKLWDKTSENFVYPQLTDPNGPVSGMTMQNKPITGVNTRSDEDTDAVNISHLNNEIDVINATIDDVSGDLNSQITSGDSDTLSSANSYTDSEISIVQDNIDDVSGDLQNHTDDTTVHTPFIYDAIVDSNETASGIIYNTIHDAIDDYPDGNIFIKNGTYNEDTITLTASNSGLSLIGEYRNGVIFDHPNDDNGISVISSETVDNVTIRNLTIRVESSTAAVNIDNIYIDNTSTITNWKITNVKFSSNNNIAFRGCFYCVGPSCNNININNCIYEGSDIDYAVYINGTSGNNSTNIIIDKLAAYNGSNSTALYIGQYTEYTNIINNTIVNILNNAIYVCGSDVLISNNIVKGGTSGIDISGGNNVNIVNNIVTDVSGYGIRIRNSSSNVILIGNNNYNNTDNYEYDGDESQISKAFGNYEGDLNYASGVVVDSTNLTNNISGVSNVQEALEEIDDLELGEGGGSSYQETISSWDDGTVPNLSQTITHGLTVSDRNINVAIYNSDDERIWLDYTLDSGDVIIYSPVEITVHVHVYVI